MSIKNYEKNQNNRRKTYLETNSKKEINKDESCLEINSKQNNKDEILQDIPHNNNVFVISNSKQKQQLQYDNILKYDDLKSYLELIIKKQIQIEQKIDVLNAKKTNRNSEEHLKRCYELIEEKGIISSDELENDSVLSGVYDYPIYRTELFNFLLEKYPDLEEEKFGQGGKRYIFKKTNKPAIRKIIKVRKYKKSSQNKQTTYDEIKDHFIRLSTTKSSINTDNIHEILRRDFCIRQVYKRRQIIKDLSKEGY